MVLLGIKNETAHLDFHLLVLALRITPTASLAAALAATALSYLALVGYDISGLRYARARAPLKTILLASFCGFAIGNSIGLGAFSGGAVRYRLYTAAGLSPGQIARVILFISVAFGVGLAAIAALGLILDAKEVSGLLGASPEPLRAGAATVLALAVGFMIFCATAPNPFATRPNRHRCARYNAGTHPVSLHGSRRACRRRHIVGSAALGGNSAFSPSLRFTPRRWHWAS